MLLRPDEGTGDDGEDTDGSSANKQSSDDDYSLSGNEQGSVTD